MKFEIVKAAFAAIGFLTVLPVPSVMLPPEEMGRASRWFPAIGLFMGVILLAAYWGGQIIFPSLVTATLVVTIWAALTGGLHLDGFCDCCDALLVPVSVERRLEIMKDPRVGAFAAIGLVLFLMLKVSSVYALLQTGRLWIALLLVPTWARWMLLLVARQPHAKTTGMGATFASGITPSTVGMALILPMGLLCYTTVFAGYISSILWIIGGLLMVWLLTRAVHKRLGGMTGDVYGLVVEVSELTMLICASASFSSVM
ncbi:MAG: adenosylcobinamide-GDP ribazoletransferase [Chloroflexota bacterium]